MKNMKVMSMNEYHEQVIHKDGPRDTAAFVMDGGFVILADDGRPLYEFRLMDDGISLEIRAGSTAKTAGKVLDNVIHLEPQAPNEIIISRPEYE